MIPYTNLFLATLIATAVLGGWTPALHAQDQNTPFKQNSSEAGKITGAFGISLGEDIRPYLEGHYTNMARDVKGPITFPAQKLTYLLLKAPVDMSASFPGSRVEYNGLANERWEVIELVLRVQLELPCDLTRTPAAVFDYMKEKYSLQAPRRNQSNNGQIYSDGANEAEASCSRNYLTIRYTSQAFEKYLTYLRAEAEREKEKTRESLKKGL